MCSNTLYSTLYAATCPTEACKRMSQMEKWAALAACQSTNMKSNTAGNPRDPLPLPWFGAISYPPPPCTPMHYWLRKKRKTRHLQKILKCSLALRDGETDHNKAMVRRSDFNLLVQRRSDLESGTSQVAIARTAVKVARFCYQTLEPTSLLEQS